MEAVAEIESIDNGGGITFSAARKEKHNGQEVDISNWKTYRNEKYGFEVRYPITHKITDYSASYLTDGRPTDIFLALSFCNRNDEFNCDGFQLLVYPKSAQKPIKDSRIFTANNFVYELSGVGYENVFSTFKFIK